MDPPDMRQAKIPAAHSWEHLPSEILDLIFSRLPSFADRACCTGVCRLWRDFAREKEHAVPPRLPCLLMPSISGASCFHFFSRTTTARPRVPAARFCGSTAGGWFVITRHRWRSYSLLHLASGWEISLPEDVLEHEVPLTEFRLGLQTTALLIIAAIVFPEPNPDDGGANLFMAAITFGQHKAVVSQTGMDWWRPLELGQEGLRGPAVQDENKRPILSEEMEDVIYYSCDQHEGFYFLTSMEHLMVFDVLPPGEEEDGNDFGELDGYLFRGRQMPPPPEPGHVAAGRYLVESERRLLMVKRFVSRGHGTVSFQVFRLEWDKANPRWELSPAAIVGKLLFVGRGCSRAIPTGRSGPGFIYFLDDAEGFPDVPSIAGTDKEYRCSDTGWCRYDPQFVGKNWPRGPLADCSPWTWLYH